MQGFAIQPCTVRFAAAVGTLICNRFTIEIVEEIHTIGRWKGSFMSI